MPSFRPFLLMLCCLLPFGAQAAAGATQPVQSLREAAEAYVRAQVGGAGGNVQVSADALDERVRLPACAAPLSALQRGASSGNRWTVAVSCAAPQTWTLYVPVRLSRQQAVLVATRNLPAGSVATAADFRTESRDTATLAQGYVADGQLVAGQMLSRPLAAGAALTPQHLARAATVKRGQLVTLIGRSGGFEVRAQGKALGDAAPGDRVTVENSASRRVVQGQLRDDGAVEVPL